MDTSLRAYSERLERALREEAPLRLYNKDIIHASTIVLLAFQYAKRRILILSNKLDSRLYGADAILKSIKTFLEKPNVELQVLVEEEIPSEHPFTLISREFPEQVSIGTVPGEVVEKYKFNFMVVDDIGYRFERDREDFAATASFYEQDAESKSKEFIARLDKIFNVLKTKSKYESHGLMSEAT